MIASKHFNLMKQYVEQQFKNVGKHKGSEQYQLYDKDNSHIFKLYASDHIYVNFCLISLYLSQRENIFIYYGYDFLFPHKERILIELGVQMTYKGFICFGITRQSQIKKIQKEGYEDLKNVCHTIKIPNLNSEFQVLTEFDEVANQLCTDEIIKTLNELEKSIHIIYVSDVDKDPSGKVQLRIMTNLQQQPDYQTLFKLVSLLARQINILKLDIKKQYRAQQNRRKYNAKYN
ncbi:hypothetical protein pb186bvf_008025 [Paramecium bursaria]